MKGSGTAENCKASKIMDTVLYSRGLFISYRNPGARYAVQEVPAMKAILLRLVLVVWCLQVFAGCSVFLNPDFGAITLDDIIIMTEERIHPDVIINTIQKSGCRFEITAAELAKLNKNNVDRKVTAHLIGMGRDDSRYKGLIIRDPRQPKQSIRGYIYIPVDIWGTMLRPADSALASVVSINEGFEKHTDVTVFPDKRLYLESSGLSRYPLLYFTASDFFDLTSVEKEHFANYLRRGGFVFIEPMSPGGVMRYHHALVSFKAMIRDAFSGNAEIRTIPVQHPVFHCFYDFHSAPYLVPKAGRDVIYPTKLFISDEDDIWFAPDLKGVWVDGRMVGVFSDNQYGRAWVDYSFDSRFDNPFFRMSVNIIVYALTRDGSSVKKYRSLEEYYRGDN